MYSLRSTRREVSDMGRPEFAGSLGNESIVQTRNHLSGSRSVKRKVKIEIISIVSYCLTKIIDQTCLVKHKD